MKKAIVAIAFAAVFGLACAAYAQETTQAPVEPEAVEIQAGSLLAVHDDAGINISAIVKEVSYTTCTTCHDWDETVAATEDMWPGLGQITPANPHAAHATNAFACADCHAMDEPQVNVCNQCHIFESPEGWVEKSKLTTNYGITATEPAF